MLQLLMLLQIRIQLLLLPVQLLLSPSIVTALISLTTLRQSPQAPQPMSMVTPRPSRALWHLALPQAHPVAPALLLPQALRQRHLLLPVALELRIN